MKAFDFSGHELVIGFIVVGAALAGYGGFFLMHQDDTTSVASSDYETVNATIKSVDVASVSSGNDTVFRPEASFTYTFNGTQYSSSNVFPSNRSYEYPADAENQINEFSEGDQITAYVDRSSPGEAFLKRPE